MTQPTLALNLDYFIDTKNVPRGEALYEYWNQAATAIADLGFTGTMTCGPEPNPPEWRENLARVLGENKLRLIQLHAPWTPWSDQLPATEEREWRPTVELYRRWLGYAQELGAEELVIHPPEHIPEDMPRDQAVQGCAQCLQEVLARAPADLRLTVENVFFKGEEQPFGGSTETVAAIIRLVGDARLGFCLDTSHIAVERLQPWLVVPGLADCLASVHFHDVSQMGQEAHLMPGTGLIDWPRFFAALKQVGFAGPLIYELNSEGTPEERTQRIKENKQWIESML